MDPRNAEKATDATSVFVISRSPQIRKTHNRATDESEKFGRLCHKGGTTPSSLLVHFQIYELDKNLFQ